MSTVYKTLHVKLNAAILILMISTAQFYWLCSFKSLPIDVSLADAFISNGMLYGIFLFWEYGFGKYPPSRFARFNITFIALQSVGFVAVWLFLCQWALKKSFNNPAYEAFWEDTFYIRALIGWILICFYNLLNYVIKNINDQEASAEKEQNSLQLRKEAELFKLRQQLHPHFLFNSLNSVVALIGKEPQQARDMVQQLSAFLRHTLKKEDHLSVSVKEEFDDLRIYLGIEQVRFGHRLSIDEQVEAACLDQRIPPFLLQPLVENAIKYGLYGTTGQVTITIKAGLSERFFWFTIANPYEPESIPAKGTGFGLESIKRRLYLLFTRNDLLTLKSVPLASSMEPEERYRFEATLHIPLSVDQPLIPAQ